MAKSRKPPSKVGTIPSPIGGWNARDPMPAMQATDAVILDNFIPGTGGVELRNGYSLHVHGLGGPIDTLMEYRSTSGNNQLFACVGEYIFNVTSAGEITDPAAENVLAGAGSAIWSYTMFETPGGHFLVACNGSNTPKLYDGSTWDDMAITGDSVPSSFASVTSHASRLFFVEKNSLNVWYLDVDSIGGTATKFPLGAVANRGGYIVQMVSWTRDGGSGPDDYAVFITSAGEAIIYSGVDPSGDFAKVGVFRIPEPIGDARCAAKSGADVGIITSQGALSLSTVLPMTLSGQGKSAVTDKIKGAFAAAYKTFGATFGWQIIEYPRNGLLIINVPQAGGNTSHQYVMNTATGSWCRFTGMDARCFSLLGANLYFGDNHGKVYRYSADYEDDGEAISATVLPAFSDFGTIGNKRFLMARPLIEAVAGTYPPIELWTNYQTNPIVTFPSEIPDAGSEWDLSNWDEASWGPAPESISDWQMMEGIGRVGSIVLSTATRNYLLLNQVDIIFEPGGVL